MGKISGCSRVCVTGGAGFIGSSLVKLLLDKGLTVHATLRNLGDESKVGLLKGFPNAEERLHLFEADIYKPEEFERAIEGCDFVCHVATPLLHTPGGQYSNSAEASVAAARSIAELCSRAKTVRRLVYTASVVAASPLKEDRDGYKDAMDETCWTPFDLSVSYANDHLREYTISKTLAEKELLSIGEDNNGGLEIVTLCCGLVGGDTYLSYVPTSVELVFSCLSNDEIAYRTLKYLEELLGKVPLVHIDDVCRAHVFCLESDSIKGRFLCANYYVSSAKIAENYRAKYPKFDVKNEYLEDPRRETEWGSRKLEEEGFAYEHDMETILDDSVGCAARRDVLHL